MLHFSIALDVVLSACEVPQEVAPIHEIALVREEELQVLNKGWYLHLSVFMVIRVLEGAFDATYPIPVLVLRPSEPHLIRVGVGSRIHAWEEHVLGISGLVLRAYDEVAVGLVRRCLFFSLVYRGTFVYLNGTLVVYQIFRTVGLSVEKRTVAVLVAAEVVAQREDVLR